MNIEEHFDKLPNISKNIEAKLKSFNKNEIIESDNIENFDNFTKDNCSNHIKQMEKVLNEDNSKLKSLMKEKNDEIAKNLDNYIKKIENDTNVHMKNIENSNLTEEEKKVEYNKCIQELENILTLSENFKNCIETSETNFFNFLSKINSLNEDVIPNFFKENENNLRNNMYNFENYDNNFSEKIYNHTLSSNLKTYIMETNRNMKLKKLVINNNSDFNIIKQRFFNLNQENKIMQNKIEKISIKKISSDDFRFLFSHFTKTPDQDNELRTSYSNELNNPMPLEVKEEPIQLKKMPTCYERSMTEPEFKIIINSKKEEENKSSNSEYKYPEIHIKNCDLENINLIDIFENTNILKLSSCNLSFYFYETIQNNSFSNMTELYLEDCNFVDENFNELIFAIFQNKNLKSNLKSLSFKNNKLTCIYLYKYIKTGSISQNKFENLEMLDLSYNRIDFLNAASFNGLPKIIVFNLSNNNFQFGKDFESLYVKFKKFQKSKADAQKSVKDTKKSKQTQKGPEKNYEGLLFQLSNNIGLLKGDEMKKYLDYLLEALISLNYPLKCIDLNGLFYCKINHNILFNINLNKFQSSLIEINLSTCNITDEELSRLLKQFCIKNVKTMKLENNKLTDKLFNLLIEDNSWDIYTKLKYIDLSNNDIHLNKIKEFKHFIKLFDSLKTIIIRNTAAEKNINNYIRKIIIRFNEKQNGEKKQTEFTNNEECIKELFEKDKNKEDYLLNSNNIKLIMKNTIDYKFIEAAQKIFPDIFNNIIIEYKYNGPN